MTTGISAHDRAHTVRTAVKSGARPEDLRQPGHIFPLMAQPGGVLTRAGHTEAGCDLARLAGFEPAAVIVEILNEDGTMARRRDLERFARTHGLKHRHDRRPDPLPAAARSARSSASRTARSTPSSGRSAWCCYEDHVNRSVHVALVRGELKDNAPPLVRVHLAETLRDVVGVRAPQLGWPLRDAMQRIAEDGNGVVVFLQRATSRRSS